MDRKGYRNAPPKGSPESDWLLYVAKLLMDRAEITQSKSGVVVATVHPLDLIRLEKQIIKMTEETPSVNGEDKL